MSALDTQSEDSNALWMEQMNCGNYLVHAIPVTYEPAPADLWLKEQWFSASFMDHFGLG